MDQYIRIKTLFFNSEDRTLRSLANYYKDLPFLKQTISDLIGDELIKTNLLSGKRVFLKPNWVMHNRKEEDEVCMRTHNNFLLAVLEVILESGPSLVCIGDAPVQGCFWDKILSVSFFNQIDILRSKFGIPIIIKDLRRVTFDPYSNILVREINPISDYVIFNLGKDSYLDPISSNEKDPFRVTNYNPDRLSESHRKGVHKYCISKELFKADIILSLPKIKTHQKTGITAALKNVVGLNGDKDFLPHHRIGGTGFGGDCYPGSNYFRYWAELALDEANRKQGKMIYWFWTKLSTALWILSNPHKEHHIAAGWYGNDTTWRMVLDLNKIVIFGKNDGTLSSEPQRKLFSIGDGIIGGQGDGPLCPTPLPLGIITFTDNSAWHDAVVSQLIRFNLEKLPLVRTALADNKNSRIKIFVNGEEIAFGVLDQFSIETLPPPGWSDFFKK